MVYIRSLEGKAYWVDFRGNLEEVPEFDNVVDYARIFTSRHEFKYTMDKDGVVSSEIPIAMKLGNTYIGAICLCVDGKLYVAESGRSFRLFTSATNFWIRRNIVLVKFPDDTYRLYDHWEHGFIRIKIDVKPEKEPFDFHYNGENIEFIYKYFNQQVWYMTNGCPKITGIDSEGNLVDAHSDYKYETPLPVRYITEDQSRIVIFLEDGSSYIVQEDFNEQPLSLRKITDIPCLPLSYIHLAKAKNANN